MLICYLLEFKCGDFMMNWTPVGIPEAATVLSKLSGTPLVYFDPDVDGLYSGYFVCKFLEAMKIPYEKYINENRMHGFFYEDVAALSGRTVIAVDFSISPDKLESLRSNRVFLVNIDHHNIQDTELVTYKHDGSDTVDGVVINNQYSFEPDDKRYLSGAGVVYYVLSHFLPSFDCELTRALVGLTLLSDIRPIENKEAETFLRTLYICRLPYIQYLIDITKAERDYQFGVPRLERNYADYTFNPKINALFRLNMGTVAMDLAFGTKPSFNLDDARLIQNQITDYIAENLKSPFNTNNLLDMQAPGVTQFVKTVTDANGNEVQLSDVVLSSLDIAYMPMVHISDSYSICNFIGLTCSHRKGFGKSCVAYVGDDSHVIRGSFRGRFDSVDYLGLFKKYGFRCDGHRNAFGIMDCDLKDVDFIGLNTEIERLEAEAERHEYENRLVSVDNLSVFMHSDLLKQIAMTNIFVRDSYRIYLKYTGTNAKRTVRGKMFEYNIDGVMVKCFDEDIDTSNGYILPIYDRNVLTFYLKNIKK